LFKDGVPRWERLIELLEKAGMRDGSIVYDLYPDIAITLHLSLSPYKLLRILATTSDYEASAAIDQFIVYLNSAQGESIKELLIAQLIEVLDQLGMVGLEVALSLSSPDGLSSFLRRVADEIAKQSDAESESTAWSMNSLNGTKVANAVAETFLDKAKTVSIMESSEETQRSNASNPALTEKVPSKTMAIEYISRIVKIFQTSGDFTAERISLLVRKVPNQSNLSLFIFEIFYYFYLSNLVN
jgi:hypothetical protein